MQALLRDLASWDPPLEGTIIGLSVTKSGENPHYHIGLVVKFPGLGRVEALDLTYATRFVESGRGEVTDFIHEDLTRGFCRLLV